MHDRNKSGRLRAVRWSLSTLAAASLVACGGGGSDAKNELPAGVREISQTSYPATSVGSGSTAATQDLLTGGIGKTGLGAAAADALYAGIGAWAPGHR